MDARPSLERWLSVGTLAYGFWLLLPFNSFATVPAFAALAKLAPEWLLGLVIVGGGIVQLALSSRTSGIAFRLRRLNLIALVVLWTFLGASVALSNLASTALPLYVWLAAGFARCFWGARSASEQ